MHSASLLTLVNPSLHGSRVGGDGVRGSSVSVKIKFAKVRRVSSPRPCNSLPLVKHVIHSIVLELGLLLCCPVEDKGNILHRNTEK